MPAAHSSFEVRPINTRPPVTTGEPVIIANAFNVSRLRLPQQAPFSRRSPAATRLAMGRDVLRPDVRDAIHHGGSRA